MTRGPIRRLAIALLGVAISSLILRSPIAQALVSRGDDFLYRSEIERARSYYRRALTFDAQSRVALDRYLFFGLQVRTKQSLEESIALSSAYLFGHPRDGQILADRALCYQFLRRDAQAERDFELAARATGDPQYFTLAGWAALRHDRPERARQLFQLALAADPAFRPAHFALARFRER